MHESTDIRDFKALCSYDILTCDVSFISIRKIFAHLRNLSSRMILLFKPQFDLQIGSSQISSARSRVFNKKGVIKDSKKRDILLSDFEIFIKQNDFEIMHMQMAQPRGKEGNCEYFFYIKKY